VQTERPLVAPNLPAGHCLAAVEPAGQYEPWVHALAVVALQYDPAGQVAQEPWPVLVWYVPAAQAVHPVADAAEYWPAAQLAH